MDFKKEVETEDINLRVMRLDEKIKEVLSIE